MNELAKRLAALIAIGSLALAACTPAASSPAPPGGSGSPGGSPGGSGGQIGGTVTVIGTWGGDEEQAFLSMVAPFEQSTGVDVQYTGTRDLEAILTTGTQSGILPDLAGLPGPGQMRQFAEQGHLIDLATVLDRAAYEADTAPAFVELGSVGEMLAGVFIKSAVKGPIWYSTANFTGEPPATFDELQALPSEPAQSKWCVALESGADSGWPGTDWIEDIVLRQSGPDVYDAWVAGTQKWTSPEIRSAFETFGQVVENSYGGSDYINSTAFGMGGNQLFADPPGCLFHHQASFITSFFQNEAGATADQYDFFPFPEINPDYAGSLTGSGDLFGMFHDTPQARALMQYLVTPEAQQIWVDIGGAISGNTQVTDYPDDISQRLAQGLAEAETFRFDAGDQMPGEMNSAFFAAIVEFADNPASLDQILTDLDAIQESAYATE